MPNDSFPSPIVPAQISIRDGALYSDRFGDIYHSVAGGIEEARHVFIGGNNLPNRWNNGGRFTIVETGFGSGLNFLVTWNELVQSNCDIGLEYVATEKYPFSREDLAQVLQAWPQFQSLARKLLDAYPPLAPGFHRLHPGPRVTLTLLFGDAHEQLTELDAHADAFFLDGFAPSRNPAMWSDALFRQIRRLAAPGATVATYSVAAQVKHALAGAGFDVRKRAGFAQKREMLVAQFPAASHAIARQRKAVVIGAGIAGASCALSLARRGVEVDLLEHASHPGAATSSNPAAVVRPFLTLDNSVRSRFGWSAFSYAVRCYRALHSRAGFRWHGSGVLQVARDEAHRDKLERAVRLHALPDDRVRLVDSREATRLCGVQTQRGGLWFPSAGYVDGRLLCNAMIEAGGPSIRFVGGVEALRIKCNESGWHVLDTNGRSLAQGGSVILANGCGARALLPEHDLQLRPVRGQVTRLPSASDALRSPVCMDGYVTPVVNGTHYVGGTFDESTPDAIELAEDHQTNVARAAHILPGVFDNVSTAVRAGWTGVRCVSRDRLPVIGEIFGTVYACLAMGSRGFSWAPLAGELLASIVVDGACPVERSVANGILPRRVLLRGKRIDADSLGRS